MNTATKNTAKTSFICFLLLVIITATLYFPILKYDFLVYDDASFVRFNPYVQSGLNPRSIAWAFTADLLKPSPHTDSWIPVTLLSLMLDVTLFGKSSLGHHLVNVLLHLFNVILLFQLWRRMTGAIYPSFMVAMLFAIHPMHVESVAWISERKDVLSWFWGLLGFHFYLSWIGISVEHKFRTRQFGLVLLCHGLSLLSKPMLVTFPFLLLLLDVWPLRRNIGPEAKSLKFLVLEKIPFLLLSVLVSVVTLWAQWNSGAVKELTSFPLSIRLQNAVVAISTYLRKMFWPTDLAVFYPHPGPAILQGQFFISLVILVVISGGVCFLFRRGMKFMGIGWTWFVISLLPVIGIIQVGDQAMADRYAYIPYVGLYAMIAFSLGELSSTKALTNGIFGLCAIFLLVLSMQQVRYWKNSITLFEHTLKVTQGNYVAHNNLGLAYAQSRRQEEAIAQYHKSIEVKPDYVRGHHNLALALAQSGRLPEAIVHLEAAHQLKPDSPEITSDLANAHAATGNMEAAVALYRKAIELKPGYAEAHNNLAIALWQLGKVPEAIEQLRKAIESNPLDAEYYFNLGSVLRNTGDLSGAAEQFSKAISMNPNHAGAREALDGLRGVAGQNR